MNTRLAIPLTVVLLAACAAGAGSARTSGAATPQRRDPNMITEEELRAAPSQTLYDAVRALRPAWLMRRTPTALMPQNETELLVYVDGTRFGNLQSLRQFSSTQVRSIRYYAPADAESRFGPGHLQGAIEITTMGR